VHSKAKSRLSLTHRFGRLSFTISRNLSIATTSIMPMQNTCQRCGMTNYRIGPHWTTSDHIESHQTTSDQI